jgi:hypothetical protein
MGITTQTPEGRLTIAQDEVLGKPKKIEPSPVGTARESTDYPCEGGVHAQSTLPSLTRRFQNAKTTCSAT